MKIINMLFLKLLKNIWSMIFLTTQQAIIYTENVGQTFIILFEMWPEVQATLELTWNHKLIMEPLFKEGIG